MPFARDLAESLTFIHFLLHSVQVMAVTWLGTLRRLDGIRMVGPAGESEAREPELMVL